MGSAPSDDGLFKIKTCVGFYVIKSKLAALDGAVHLIPNSVMNQNAFY
jgi:hypothetical protein